MEPKTEIIKVPEGALMRFECQDDSGSCWQGGIRLFFVTVKKKDGKCVVNLIYSEDHPAELIDWDQSYEESLFMQEFNFTRSCLELLERELLSAQLNQITSFEVISSAGIFTCTKPLGFWAAKLQEKYGKPATAVS